MVSHLGKTFGAVRAVEDVSFEVYPGEIFGLLGPNGAGKTTSIRMMLDIFSADQGEISVLGGRMDEAKKNRIGYLPEERGLYKDLKLEPTLIFLAQLKGLDEKTARARLTPWLKRLDLYDHRTKKIQELSKGMQQKAQLIATLLHQRTVDLFAELGGWSAFLVRVQECRNAIELRLFHVAFQFFERFIGFTGKPDN